MPEVHGAGELLERYDENRAVLRAIGTKYYERVSAIDGAPQLATAEEIIEEFEKNRPLTLRSRTEVEDWQLEEEQFRECVSAVEGAETLARHMIAVRTGGAISTLRELIERTSSDHTSDKWSLFDELAEQLSAELTENLEEVVALAEAHPEHYLSDIRLKLLDTYRSKR